MNEQRMSNENFGRMLDEMATRFQPVLEEKAHEAIRELGLTKADRKHSVFPGIAEDMDVPASERTYRFFRAVLGGDIVGVKALSEGTASAGGYLVPDELRNEIIARMPDGAELAPYVRIVPVRTDTGSMPSLATDISITWRAGSTGENTAFGESDPVLGQITWSLKRADAITKLSRELVADSQPSIVEFVTRLFQEAIATERDKQIATGDGSTEPLGLSNTTGLTAIDVAGAVDFTHLVQTEQSLKKKYRRRARWIMNGTNLRRIYSLVDSQSRPIFVRDVVEGCPESRILGYPVSQQDDLADSEIYFGDLSYYLWFDREEMGIESTIEGGDAFEKHQTWIKVWERADGKVGLKEAFIKASGITG